MTSVGTLGVPYQVRETDRFYFKDGNLTWLRKFKDSVIPEYVLYWLQSPVAQRKLDEVSIGSTQRALTIVELKSVEFPLPPKDVQAGVVRIAKSLDRKLETNRRINQTLEQMAQAIFKSWFVDFEPVKAKMEAKKRWYALQPGNEPASPVCYAGEPQPLPDLETCMNLAAMQAISGKTPEQLARMEREQPDQYARLRTTAELFPSAMQPSELGEIPEGWKTTAIQEVAEVIKGKSYKSSELSESKTALVTLKSFNRGGGYRLDGLKEYVGKYKPKQEVFAGDLIIAYTDVTQAADVIGKPAMVISDARYEHLVISLDVAVVRPFKSTMKPFLHGLALTEQFQYHTRSHTTGTTVLHLGKNAVPEYEFALPPEMLIESYAKQVNPSFESIDQKVQESRSLEALRDTILPKLLSGEMTVPEAQAAASGALDNISEAN